MNRRAPDWLVSMGGRYSSDRMLVSQSANWFCVLLTLPTLMLGCSSNSMLTVHSEPEGAALTAAGSGASLGRAPAVLVFASDDLENARQANGCYLVRGIEATWPSGAALTTKTIELCGDDQRNFEVVLQRPTAAPNLEQDVDYARAMRAADMEQHRRDQQHRTQYFPLQTPAKPNGPAQPSSPSSP